MLESMIVLVSRAFLESQQSEKFDFADIIPIPWPTPYKLSANTVVSVFQVLNQG
jgi:hypothetical protein